MSGKSGDQPPTKPWSMFGVGPSTPERQRGAERVYESPAKSRDVATANLIVRSQSLGQIERKGGFVDQKGTKVTPLMTGSMWKERSKWRESIVSQSMGNFYR